MNSANKQKAVKPFLSSGSDQKCTLEGKKNKPPNKKKSKKDRTCSVAGERPGNS